MSTSPEPKRPVHFSMIRGFHLADLLTIANGVCGVGAIFHGMRFLLVGGRWLLWAGFALVLLAIVFDLLDGRVARWRHEASAMGREMDSLADVISFGVAPACLAWAAGLQDSLDVACLLFFAASGLSRLARYNVAAAALAGPSEKVAYFEGTPITFSIIPLGILLATTAGGAPWLVGLGPLRLHPIALLFVVSGSLMMSKTIRIPKP
jgi:CDP-diacylglycerol--serine O-phosphatidyltransferase